MTIDKKNYEVKANNYDVILFDEICSYDTKQLKCVSKLLNLKSDVKIYASGDQYQNLPIENNIISPNTYYNDIINSLFPIQLNLQHSRRVKTIEEELMLKSMKSYIFENFDYQHIDFQKEAVFYKNIEIKKILFCEGYEACQNPFFNWLPFNPVKGENLIVLVEDYPLTEIINQGTFILPIDGQGKCRLGATYSWDNLDWDITDEARDSLEEKIKGYLKKPYQILEQQAGIRPSTDDRRPFVGLHPEHPELGIFNGLGTKGVTLAPYFSEQFAKFLESGEDLDAEVNIERVFSLYFRSKLS